MELSYLYFPEYHESAPRPDSTGVSLRPLCEKLSGEAAAFCGYFIGESYLAGNSRNISGAFEECSIAGDHQESCATRLGQISVSRIATTEEKALSFCAQHAGSLAEACVQGARKGRVSGFAPAD